MKGSTITFTAGLIALLVSAGSSPAAVFNCPAGDVACLISAINMANGTVEADTINLAAGAYTLTEVDNEANGPNGLPSISSPITIRGAGASSTIVQRDPLLLGFDRPVFRVLHVAASGSLTLEALTIRNGHRLVGETEDVAGGGGIFNLGATTIANCTIARNATSLGEGGGGISNGGTLSLIRSRVERNVAVGRFGGGIHNRTTGMLTIDQSTLGANTADAAGGIWNSGLAFIRNSTIAGNSTGVADFGPGGGIANIGGTLTIESSTIAFNRCEDPIAEGNVGGGGIYVRNGSVSVNNSTIADNSVQSSTRTLPRGGGIFNAEGEAGTVELQNTILARNVTRPLGEPGSASDCFGSVTSLGNNLVGDTSDCTISLLASDLTGDPGLDTFADDGTPGNGHFPLLGISQAVDAGDSASCTLTDQLGHSRVDGDGDGTVICDIGAIEFSPPPIDVSDLLELEPLITVFDPIPVPFAPAGRFFIKATFTNKSLIPIHDPVFMVKELSGGNLLLNADGGPGQPGARLTPDVGPDAVVSPDESFTTEFVIGLQSRKRFTFLVDVLGAPGPP